MSMYLIATKGCDDSTYIIVDLTDDEVATVRQIAEAVTAASSYNCQPSLSIKPFTEADESEVESARESAEQLAGAS